MKMTFVCALFLSSLLFSAFTSANDLDNKPNMLCEVTQNEGLQVYVEHRGEKEMGTVPVGALIPCGGDNFSDPNKKGLLTMKAVVFDASNKIINKDTKEKEKWNVNQAFMKITDNDISSGGHLFEVTPHATPTEGFLEGVDGKKVQAFDSLGLTYLDNKSDTDPNHRAELFTVHLVKTGNGEERASQALDENGNPQRIFIVNSGWANYYDPIEHQQVGKMSYKIDIVPDDPKTVADYLAGKKIHGIKTGWIDSDRISREQYKTDPNESPKTETSESETAAKPDCCGQKPSVVEEMKNKLAKKQNGRPLTTSEIIDKNRCVEPGPKLKKELAADQSSDERVLVSGWRQKLKAIFVHQNKPDTTKNGPPKPTVDQLVAIDLMARTLYGEMRSCHNKLGPQYSKAVARILLNLAEFCDGGACHCHQKPKPTSQLAESISDQVGRKSQFQCWKGISTNSDSVMCVPTTNVDLEVWHDVIDIAEEAIMNPEKLKQETKGVGDCVLHYTSGMTPYWASSMDRVRKVFIDGYPTNHASCLMMYKNR